LIFLTAGPRRVDWFTNPFNSWTAFRKSSVERIETGAAHLVLTDITGFYENVDLGILFSDLRQLGCDPEVLKLLQVCLNRWCILLGRGLPQGLSPSGILAKIYMNAIDRRMIDLGRDYIRYVDDIRIFCPDVPTAKRALIELAGISRRRGLNLQSAKTSILTANEALKEFQGIAAEIAAIQKRYREFLLIWLEPSIRTCLFRL
jgi:Reverse transcriptase (RNA-dependent DNA polymerase)